MNIRDENVLREMNLYPLWVRKEMPAQVESIDSQASLMREVVPEIPPILLRQAQDRPSLPLLGEGLAFPLARGEAVDWNKLKAQVKDCTACKLRAESTQTVFGVGDENADWLLVGDQSGAEEDAQGQPFVGQAGKLLDNMLAAIQLKRGTHTYISNVIKCRPAQDNHPSADEIATCLPYLQQQIAFIQPKLIVALGKTAAMSLLGKDVPLGSLRGSLHDYQGIPVVVTYHPAYLLRAPSEKARAWADLQLAVKTMQARQT